MSKIIARLQHDDGKYHYGLSTTSAPQLGQLYGIQVEGTGELPGAPAGPATPAQHEQWLSSLKARGFKVTVTPIEEPTP